MNEYSPILRNEENNHKQQRHMFSWIDWSIILIYLVFAFSVGVWMSRSAGQGITSYFIADRKLPWWWLGTSMVATSFAADTPLAITGIIANDGISGNWFWWSWILTFVTITFFFARRWCRSRVLTDVELIELRYDGRSAAILRWFKAFYMGVIVNCVILGWVFRAMSKITSPFIDWQMILNKRLYNALLQHWPDFLIFDNFNNTLTVLIIFVIVVIYSSMGGIRGVILTDLFQFALAMITAVLFAIYAVQYVGGLDSLLTRLHTLYPLTGDDILSFWPKFDGDLFPLEVFLIFVAIQWWAQYYSDGSGYIAQRINTAKTPADAEKGTLLFTMANFGLRTWPWVVVALVALVVFPLENPTQFHEMGSAVAGDREMGYPVLMKLILPPGLLGLTFASLMAAFMSTVDTHINWGASYMANDVYRRFLRPNASERELVIASRASVVLLSVVAVFVASQISSIEKAWKFFVALGAGLGLPQILRWVWWRANAWTEITGMCSAFLCAVVLYSAFPDTRDEYLIFWTVMVSSVLAIAVTFITRPVKPLTLRRFIIYTAPLGFWRDFYPTDERQPDVYRRLLMWVLGLVATFSGMFCIGYFIRLEWLTGFVLLTICIICFDYLLQLIRDSDDPTGKSGNIV